MIHPRRGLEPCLRKHTFYLQFQKGSIGMTNQEIISKGLDQNQQNGLLMGNCEDVLAEIPDESIDCVITSPPYWQMRKYHTNGNDADSMIGEEKTPEEYVKKLAGIFR